MCPSCRKKSRRSFVNILLWRPPLGMQIPMSFLKTWMYWRRRIHLERKKLWFRCSKANTKTPQYEWLGPGAGISPRPAEEVLPAERAAQCAAPTDETDSSAAGDRNRERVDTGRAETVQGGRGRVASLSLRPIHLQPVLMVGEALGPPTRDVQHRKSPPIRLACARHLLPRREKASGG